MTLGVVGLGKRKDGTKKTGTNGYQKKPAPLEERCPPHLSLGAPRHSGGAILHLVRQCRDCGRFIGEDGEET